MIRGTTPTLSFILPFDTGHLTDGWVTISQAGEIVIDKQLSACSCEANKVRVKLTQEETLQLADRITYIQLRVKTNDGDVLASEIITTEARKILKEGAI